MPKMSAGPLSRRALLTMGAATPLLGACTSDSNSDSAQVLVLLRQSLGKYFGDSGITLSEAAQVPYASIGVREGDKRQELFVLAMHLRDVYLWASASHLAVETQFGRITRMSGFEHDAALTLASGSDPLQSHTNFTGSCEYEIDLPDRNIYRARVRYELRQLGAERIDVLGTRLNLLRLSETGQCTLLNWEFQNNYWLDPANAFVWRSTQFVHPDLDAVELVVFRPPA